MSFKKGILASVALAPTMMRPDWRLTVTISTGSLSLPGGKAFWVNLTMAWARSASTDSSCFRVLSGRVRVTGRLGSLNLGGRPPRFRCGIVSE